MRSFRPSRRRAVPLIAAALLIVGACGGDDSGDDSDSTTATTTAESVADTTGAPDTTGSPDTTGGGSTEETTATTEAEGSTSTAAPDGPEPVAGGELIVGEIFDAFGFDPATLVGGVTDGAIGYALYDPLTTYNAAGELEMWLAKSVESDDQQTWTITLQEGVQFHDGTPFDAEAVKINLERHKDPNTKSRAIGNASNIESITVIDPTTVEIALKFPWAAFPELLAGNLGLMASPTAIASGTLNTAPVGTGPFVFSERIVGDRVIVTRNDNYWRENEPYLDQVTFRVVLDDAVRTASVANGEIQAGQSINGAVLADAADGDDVTSSSGPGHPNTIHLNTQSGPTADVRVRQALALALDYEAINDVVYEGAAPRDGHFITSESPFYDESVEFPAYDLDQAKALVEEYEAENGPISFTFRCYSEPSRIQMSQLVTQMWSQAGMDVEVQLSDQITLVLDIFAGNFTVGCLSLGAENVDPDLMYYNLFHSTSPTNYGKYSNPEMDAALVAGRTSQDEAGRAAAYSTVQELMAQDMPVIEWSRSPWGWVLDTAVGGFETLPGSEFHTGSVFLAAD